MAIIISNFCIPKTFWPFIPYYSIFVCCIHNICIRYLHPKILVTEAHNPFIEAPTSYEIPVGIVSSIVSTFVVDTCKICKSTQLGVSTNKLFHNGSRAKYSALSFFCLRWCFILELEEDKLVSFLNFCKNALFISVVIFYGY